MTMDAVPLLNSVIDWVLVAPTTSDPYANTDADGVAQGVCARRLAEPHINSSTPSTRNWRINNTQRLEVKVGSSRPCWFGVEPRKRRLRSPAPIRQTWFLVADVTSMPGRLPGAARLHNRLYDDCRVRYWSRSCRRRSYTIPQAADIAALNSLNQPIGLSRDYYSLQEAARAVVSEVKISGIFSNSMDLSRKKLAPSRRHLSR
jgi:hypothetical protein